MYYVYAFKFVFLSLYINIEKNIRMHNIKSHKMLTLRFFFPSVYIIQFSKVINNT
jgi:hypothetical protein